MEKFTRLAATISRVLLKPMDVKKNIITNRWAKAEVKYQSNKETVEKEIRKIL